MCMTEQSELSYKAMDETAEYAHELHAHVQPEQQTSLLRDFLVMWSGIDWFWSITTVVGFAAGVLTIVCGMLAITSLLGHGSALERVLAAIGGAL